MSENAIHVYCDCSYRRKESERMLRYTGFLPNDPAVYREFFRKNLELGQTRMLTNTAHVSAVAGFEAAIKSDPIMVALFNEVFMQAARVAGIPPIDNFDQLLYLMDGIVSQAPTFYVAEDDTGNVTGEPIGIPIYLLFDLFSNTRAAYDLFRMPAFNAAMKSLLDIWGEYLMTKDSTSVLNDGSQGWFSPLAMKLLDGGRFKGDFNSTYVIPDASSVTRGYISWDDFFTREIQPHARPIVGEDDLSLIHNACESTVFNIQRGVKLHDQFWLKSRPYSLYDMLAKNTEDATKFIGGAVYQASLGPQDYHRWHSPINGTVIKVANVPGTYYAVIPDEGAATDDPDLKPNDPHGALFRSQGYLTLSAARALIFIESPNPNIGLMCFIGIGMCEVSTCQISVKPGDKVAVGQQLGMFHFGGSSHALVFGPQANVVFSDIVRKDKHIHVHTVIAQVCSVDEN